MGFSGEVDKFGKRSSNLRVHVSYKRVRRWSNDIRRPKPGRATYIHGNMTDYSGMIRQANVFGIMAAPIHSFTVWRFGVLVYDEGPLHVDLDRARMGDGAVYLSSIGAHAQVL